MEGRREIKFQGLLICLGSRTLDLSHGRVCFSWSMLCIARRNFSSATRHYKQFIPNMSLDYTAGRAKELIANANTIKQEVATLSSGKTNLVCVSKLKPAADIQALYDVGYRHFGENYVQELIEKAKVLPKDIKWHFIGGLQTNKCKDLAKNISNLYAVETIDTIKKAKKLNEVRKQMIEAKTPGFGKVGILIQLNTSGEEQKSGCEPGEELDELVKFILEECDSVDFHGLMTIGSYAVSHGEGENKEFKLLGELREHLHEKFGISGLQLSMGMSGDYKQAISQGSTSVRVGSSIFGSRPANNGH